MGEIVRRNEAIRGRNNSNDNNAWKKIRRTNRGNREENLARETIEEVNQKTLQHSNN